MDSRRSKLDLHLPEKAPSPRVQRVSKEVKQILSDIFLRQELPPIFDENNNVVECPFSLTITNIKLSSDLKECKVFLTSLGKQNVDFIERYFMYATPVVRKMFAKKSVLKFVPNFVFLLDETLDKIEKLDNIFKINRERSANLESD